MKPSLLILTTYFTPDITANGVIVGHLTNQLTDLGHQVTVVTTVPHYADNSIADDWRGNLWSHERLENFDVYRLYIYVPSDKSRLVGRLLNYLSFNVLAMVAMLILGRHDMIFAPSPPLTNGLVANFIGRLRGTPVIYNVQDIYPDIAVKLGVLTNPKLIAVFRWMEGVVYRYSSAISVISEGFRDNLVRKGVPAGKISVIPNFVDTEGVKPGERLNDFRKGLALSDDCFLALFAGNVGLSQGLETVLHAAQLLSDNHNIRFLIVGNGAAKPQLQDMASEMELDNVTFLPYQPHEVVQAMYASADVGLVPLRHGIAQDSVPSKLLTLMAAGRPIVAGVDAESDAWKLIQYAQCGICVEPEDSQTLANALEVLYNNSCLATKMGMNGRRYVECNYSLGQVAEQYSYLFESVATTVRSQ